MATGIIDTVKKQTAIAPTKPMGGPTDPTAAPATSDKVGTLSPDATAANGTSPDASVDGGNDTTPMQAAGSSTGGDSSDTLAGGDAAAVLDAGTPKSATAQPAAEKMTVADNPIDNGGNPLGGASATPMPKPGQNVTAPANTAPPPGGTNGAAAGPPGSQVFTGANAGQGTDPGAGTTTPPPPATTPPASTSPGGTTTTTPPAPAQPAAGTTAWSPTPGIVDQVKKADVQSVTASDPGAAQTAGTTGYTAGGYTAQQAPDAQGYDAQGYDAATAGENMTQATDRIMGKDSEILQHTQAMADQQANSRGILNSTMAIQAGRSAILEQAQKLAAGDIDVAKFNAQAKNDASAFLANAKNTQAQFLAAEKNNNGRFNADQANQASAFTANAANVAAQFLAASKNDASKFNAEQANNMAVAAAQMKQAASEFNATAFNQASQRYTDAANAALAAHDDAENLSRRDTAQLGEQRYESDTRNAASVTAAGISASATMGAAQLASQDRAAALKQQGEQFGMQLSQHQIEFASNLSASQFTQFQGGLTGIMTSQLEPDAKQNAIHNYMAVWSASGSLPFNVDLSQFPSATTP
jgi:hypothetical protein